MKEKTMFRRIIRSALATILVCGMLPVGALAHEESGHTHTESCYAAVGELLCQLPEEAGHAHDESCYCPGGELICELEETDEHAHGEDCFCSGGELVCEREEAEGHTHGDTCYAQGGELICGLEETPEEPKDPEEGVENPEEPESSEPEEPQTPAEPETPEEPQTPAEPETPDEPEVPASPDEGEYDDIKALLLNDDSIDFDPETQTFILIRSNHIQSEHLQELAIPETEAVIDSKTLRYGVYYDNQNHDNWLYYTLTEGESDLTEWVAEDINWNSTNIEYMAVDLSPKQLGIVLLDQGVDYTVYSDIDNYYYGYMTGGESEFERQKSYICRPVGNRERVEYSGTAGSEVMEAEFSFEWDLCVWMDMELCTADLNTKNISFPGFLNDDEGIDTYVEYYVELRDEDGNIFPMPQTFYINYAAAWDDTLCLMKEDGVISIDIGAYKNGASDYCPYGEFDFYIPVGYDYRITLRNIAIDSLGGFAYYYADESVFSDDGFHHRAPFSQDDLYEYWAYELFIFMPCTRQIRVEKAVTGTADADADYLFSAQQLVRTTQDTDERPFYYYKGSNYYENLAGYPYRLFDAATDTEITGSYKTDVDGTFTLKAGQYALFDVWELPEDIADYQEDFYFFLETGMYKDIPDLETESAYIFTELGSEDAETTITYTDRNGEETLIEGKTVEDVYGGDEVLFLNRYSSTEPSVGALTVSNAIEGNAADPCQIFNFQVSASDSALSGTFGDMTFSDGVATFSLRDGESATTENLPAGVTYEVTELEANQNGYETTSVGAAGSITENEIQIATFVNTKNIAESNQPEAPAVPNKPDAPSTPDEPEAPSVPSEPEAPSVPGESEAPSVPDETEVPAVADEFDVPDDANAPDTSDVFAALPTVPDALNSAELPDTPNLPDSSDFAEESAATTATSPALPSPRTDELDSVPQTGDSFPAAALFAVFSISAVGIFFSLRLMQSSPKRKEHE